MPNVRLLHPKQPDLTSLITNCTALLNVIETLMNIVYLYLAHVAQWSPAPLVGFAAATMTLSKTVLYWAQEYYCGYCAVGHNNAWDLFWLWILPNGSVRPIHFIGLYPHWYRCSLWIVVPALIVRRLGGDLVDSLNDAQKVVTKSNAKQERPKEKRAAKS